MKTISVLFFTTIFAIQTANAQQKSHSHTEHLDVLIEHYLVMKNALVQDNFEKAKSASHKFAERI